MAQNAAEHITSAEEALSAAEKRTDTVEGWTAQYFYLSALTHALIALAKRP